MAIRIIRCHPRRFESLVAFVAAHNSAPEHHIGYFGLTPEDVRDSLRSFPAPFARAMRLAVDGGRLVGACGADLDAALGRAWLYGPLVTAEPWDATADALYAALAGGLPAAIGQHEMFVDSANARCRAFAARHGFALSGESSIYTLPAARLDGLSPAAADPWQDRYAPQLAALHERLFPGSNYTVDYMRREWAERGAILLLLTEGEALRGYFFGHAPPHTGEAYVDLVGVDESRRRAGLGRRLMLAGLAAMRGTPGLAQVALTVAAGNAAARALYDDLGFGLERQMVAFRRTIAPQEELP